jgi:URI fold toxin 2
MKIHGNSNNNTNPHHLYEIRDSVDDDVFKYGISDEPIDEEGQSDRMKLQVNFLNLGVNWLRFFARILLFDISDRRKAKRIEKEHIKNYKDLNGRRPRGNLED